MSAAVAAMLLLALPARSPQAAPEAPAAAPLLGFHDYVGRALDASPEVGQAEAGSAQAEAQWKSQTAAAWLPTLSFTGTGYPYGHNPANNYQFTTWRLNRSDMSFNTTVDFNLFNSFGDALRVKSARLGRDATRQALFASRQDRAIVAAQAYLDLSLRERLLEVAREYLKAQEDQYRLTKDLYEHGMKSLADLLKSETDWRSSALLLVSAQANRRRALVQFNALIDRSPEEEARVEAQAAPTAELKPLAQDLEAAEVNRPELRRAQALLDQADVATSQAVRDALPNFSVDFTWNHQDTANFGQPVTALTGFPNPNYQLGLRLALPSGFNFVSQGENWLAAKQARRAAAQGRRALVRQVRTEAVDARISLEQALASAQLASEKAEIALRNLELVTEQYKQGSADVIRLAQAQLDYLQARTERSQADHDAGLSLLSYRRAIGERLWP